MLVTPVLFIAFNRPELTQKVFEKISEAKPNKLYVAIDGPRQKNKLDYELFEAIYSHGYKLKYKKI